MLDVPATATARVRELSRGARRKHDRIDAASAACVAAAQGDARPVVVEDHVDALALLDDRRNNLSQNRTRTVNQLHRFLPELLASGVPTDLTAVNAIAPGLFESKMTKTLLTAGAQAVGAQRPLGRIGRPEDRTSPGFPCFWRAGPAVTSPGR